MLSRVAESIYWMSRYVERAENLARFMDVTLNLIIDDTSGTANEQWEPLVRATGDEERFSETYDAPTHENVCRFLTFDREYPNSILASLSAARENARTVREAISSESWEQLNGFYHFVKNASSGHHGTGWEPAFFSAVKERSHLFNGIVDATMARDHGWHFANLGRHMERADKTSRILDVKYFTLLPSVNDVGTTIDDLQWSSVLRSVSAFEMYRKRYHGITVHRVVEFLVLNSEFPRAVHYCVNAADESLHAITETRMGSYSNPAEQRLGKIRSELAFADIDSMINNGLHEFVDNFQRELNAVGEAIFQTFFAIRPIKTPNGMAGQTQTQTQSFPAS